MVLILYLVTNRRTPNEVFPNISYLETFCLFKPAESNCVTIKNITLSALFETKTTFYHFFLYL